MNLSATVQADDFVEAMEAFAVGGLLPNQAHELIDQAEERMLELYPRVELEVMNLFTPGLYSRTIHMPKGSLLSSQIHKTEHQFVILVGQIAVWTAHEGAQLLRAPYHGKTLPGTRRILYAHTDTVWVTFHPTSETDPDKLREELTEEHQNPLLEKTLS